MAETSWLIDPTNGTSIFLNTYPVEKIRSDMAQSSARVTQDRRIVVIAARANDDARYPPREFESLEAAHVFLRLTEGEP